MGPWPLPQNFNGPFRKLMGHIINPMGHSLECRTESHRTKSHRQKVTDEKSQDEKSQHKILHRSLSLEQKVTMNNFVK